MGFKKLISIWIIAFLVMTTISSSLIMAQATGTYTSRSAYSVQTQTRPSFQTYYSSDQITTYWPILGNKDTCEARQDMMLQVPPIGCQPAVVRSDLLAEQDVPVFCQIDAVNINPLLDISQIRSMSFTGQYPPEVAGTGFHPARAALRTNNVLLGSPLVNNVGYVVVVLKRQPVESKLPDFVNFTLTANIDYISGNAYGVGRSEFVLGETTDSEWETEKLKQSFWNGRYFVRLEQVTDNFADVSIYQGDRKVLTTRVNKGETSQKVFVPGMYCRAGLQITYDSFVGAENKARIEVSSGNDVESFDVYEGSNFLDNRCRVSRIQINEDGETGKVTGTCQGENFELVLENRTLSASNIVSTGIYLDGQNYKVTVNKGDYWVDLSGLADADRKSEYVLDERNDLYKVELSRIVLGADGNFDGTVKEKDMIWTRELYNQLMSYKTKELSINAPKNLTNSSDANSYFNAAIENYEKVADDYSAEGNGSYGKEALTKAIELAGVFGKDETKIRLMNKYLEKYPDGENAAAYDSQLGRMREIDFSLAGEAIEFEDKARVVRLVSLDTPSEKSSAEIFVENQRIVLNKGENVSLNYGGTSQGNLILDDVQSDNVKLSAYCMITEDGKTVLSNRQIYTIKTDETNDKLICGLNVQLDKTNLEEVAKIRIIPSAEGTQTQTNFTVGVGIEKRAIQLTPDKVQEKIDNLNKSIEKWEKITKNLGKVVSGLKGACFATAAFLTFKNFMTGLNGETIARQDVMRGEKGWTNRCRDMVARKEKGYTTLDQCFTGEGSKIDAEVARRTAALNKVNQDIQAIQSKPEYITDNGILGKAVDNDKVRLALAEKIVSQYGNEKINMGNKTWLTAEGKELKNVTVAQVLTTENVQDGLISTDALRSMYVDLELKKQGIVGGEADSVNSRLSETTATVNQAVVINSEFKKAEAEKARGYPSPVYVGSKNQQNKYADVVPMTETIKAETGFSVEGEKKVTHIAVVNANPVPANEDIGGAKFEPGSYVLGLNGNSQTGIYTVVDVSKKGSGESIGAENVPVFTEVYGIGNIKAADRLSYNNEIVSSDRKVQYYETEPYRGMPAVVPFNAREGWYAATKQNLPAFGGIGAFDASGRVTSFWLCNVGENGRIEFNTGYGDDLCEQVNLNTGQPIEYFPGLDKTKATNLVNQATRAIEDAARQYGNKYVTVAGERFEVGPPAVGNPGTNCQDFMSPKDCHLMFNVCDPVICPSSRCNFGGTYYVSNVVQTGIIGSTLLCLPNIKEGIIIPVCLTGIHAGIEGFISIMKNYRDCLQESLDTGEMVGICDEIYSIYLCEFFWNQVAPFVNVLIPKLIELAYGQGTRGGAEYLSVMGAWQNMENSVSYFTQSYAVNSIQAFQARSVQEVGTEVCKAFVSVKSPTAFKSLIEPDSPPQFHAWFDEKTFTTATVPATSQYKVFYHIFAGKDQGVYFNVYLKNPPQSSYYATSPFVSVASGFAAKGQYASETKDFTAPQGYKELCVRVNNDEECGFGQVSTSFAVNYVTDSYVNSEIKNADIKSEKECISGSNNLGALVNPNIQAGVENVVSPNIYNKGVVRICASKNPGQGTDPSRFVSMGYCDDPKISCWLDKRSVENAISTGNVGMKNETLSELEQRSIENLQAEGTIMTKEEANAELMNLEDALVGLRASSDKITEGNNLLQNAELISEKLFWNYHKAQLLLIKGEINEIMALSLKTTNDKAARIARDAESASGGTGTPVGYVLPSVLAGNTPKFDSTNNVWYVDFGGTTGKFGIDSGNNLKYYFKNAWVVSGDWTDNDSGKSWREQVRQALIGYKEMKARETPATASSFVYTIGPLVEPNGEIVLSLNGASTDYYLNDNLVYFKYQNNLIGVGEVIDGIIQVNDANNVLEGRYSELQLARIEGWNEYRIDRGFVEEGGTPAAGTAAVERPWTFERAIAEAESRGGTYSVDSEEVKKITKGLTNKEFIGQIRADNRLSQTDYNEIVGGGLFDWNVESYMSGSSTKSVANILKANFAKTQTSGQGNSQETTPPSTQVTDASTCDTCGIACDREECAGLGSCYFVTSWLGLSTDCKFCKEINSCSDYKTSQTCGDDQCKKNCEWKNEVCVAKNAEVSGSDEGTGASGGELELSCDAQHLELCILESDCSLNGGFLGTDGVCRSGTEKLPINDRFKVLFDETNYRFYHHLKGEDSLEPTGLFIRKGTLVLSFNELGNRVGTVDRRVELLGDWEYVDITLTNLNSFNLVAGDTKMADFQNVKITKLPDAHVFDVTFAYQGNRYEETRET